MSFADDLRKETVTDHQRALEEKRDILAHRAEYVESFRYACREAAHSGKRTCTLKYQGNYDDHLCNFYTDDYNTVKEISIYAEEALRKDGFKKLNISIVRFTSNRAVERKMLTGILGRYRYEKKIYYTLQIEAKW